MYDSEAGKEGPPVFKLIGALIVALTIVVMASIASAEEPRTGVLDSPRESVTYEFDSSSVEFGPVDTEPPRQQWIVPEGVTYAIFELWGGSGDSGEGRGHVLAGVSVKPGDTYTLGVPQSGEGDAAIHRQCLIPEYWECPNYTAAAGGDNSPSINDLPAGANPAIERWEGGGPDSEPGPGRVIIHYGGEIVAPKDEAKPVTGPVTGQRMVVEEPAHVAL